MNRPDPRYEYMSLDDFEEMLPDKPRDEKWELIGGRVIRMMVGARWEHSEVCSNLQFALTNHIRQRGLPCRTFRETFWLKHRSIDLAVFPDLQVHCGPLSPGQTSIDDPVILVEVVSRGSEFRDRVEKKGFYEKLPSVAHILFVSLEQPEAELLTRKDTARWEVTTVAGLAGMLSLTAISFDLPLAEVYRSVFDTAAK